MLRENEDTYVHFYIQLQNSCIAYETLLWLESTEKMTDGIQLEEGGNMQIEDSPSAIVGGAWAVWCHTAQKIKMSWKLRL